MLTCLLPWPRNHFFSPGHADLPASLTQKPFFLSGSWQSGSFLDPKIIFPLWVMLACLLPWPRNHFFSPGHDNSALSLTQKPFFLSGSCWLACFLDLEISFPLRVMTTRLLPWPRNQFPPPGHDNSPPSLTQTPFFPLRVITSIYLSGILPPRY